MSPNDPEFDAKIAETIRKIDDAVAQAEQSASQLTQAYAQAGLTRGTARRFIANQPPSERAKAEKELAAFREEIEQELAQVAAQTTHGNSSSRPMKPGRIRI